MQTGRTSTDGPIGLALAGWRRVRSLAPALADPNGVYLVLDPSDGRILHASAASHGVADMLADGGGASLARQAAQAAPPDGTACLARLRLDPRRLAPPVVCLLSAATLEDGERAILLVPTVPVTVHRSRPASLRGAVEPQAPPFQPVPELPRSGDRFLWRSDAQGVVTALSGATFAHLLGRSWDELAQAGRITGADAVLAALRERRTFRAAPASIHVDGHAPLPVELSGTPVSREAGAFAGFGLVRADPESLTPADTASVVTTAGEDCEDVQGTAAPQPDAAPPPKSAPAVVVVEPRDSALSTDEHAAFREIARALGARYAGDEVSADPEPDAQRPPSGAVMPFPGPQVDCQPDPSVEPKVSSPEEAALLCALPVPALVHRDDAILAANRPLLDVTGFTDLDALREAGIGRLFRGLAPESAPTAVGETTVEAADGSPRPVEFRRGTCSWAGAPATCLILRPLDEDDAARALDAERLARQAQAARTLRAETALDAVAAAVVTLDTAGRVVALNRAASDLFACDAREVVGAAFDDLFDAEGAPDVASTLRDGEGTVSVAGRTLALRISEAGPDGRRVAVLDAARPGDATTSAADGPPGTPNVRSEAALRLLDRALRAPLHDIGEAAAAMMREPYGPIGDPRYRDSFQRIHATGEGLLAQLGELLDLAAVEAGTLKLDRQPLALNEVVAGCVARLQPEAVRGRIVLRTSFSSDLDTLEADERSVSRAASLVIEHAIRRSAAGGQVIVSTGGGESAEVALRVRDTAASRPDPEAVKPGPSGDGLALPRALVEANGGRLRLANRGDDDGTLVEIILPAKRA